MKEREKEREMMGERMGLEEEREGLKSLVKSQPWFLEIPDNWENARSSWPSVTWETSGGAPHTALGGSQSPQSLPAMSIGVCGGLWDQRSGECRQKC